MTSKMLNNSHSMSAPSHISSIMMQENEPRPAPSGFGLASSRHHANAVFKGLGRRPGLAPALNTAPALVQQLRKARSQNLPKTNTQQTQTAPAKPHLPQPAQTPQHCYETITPIYAHGLPKDHTWWAYANPESRHRQAAPGLFTVVRIDVAPTPSGKLQDAHSGTIILDTKGTKLENQDLMPGMHLIPFDLVTGKHASNQNIINQFTGGNVNDLPSKLCRILILLNAAGPDVRRNPLELESAMTP